MKKVYAGSELAAVVLDSPEEIKRVTKGLMLAARLNGDENERRELRAIVAELRAPAPE